MNKDPSSVINSYKRRQQTGPFILWGAVVLLVVVGLMLLIVWLAKPNSPLMAMFASQTPTATVTASATSTLTPTETPTETPTATITLSPTASKPFEYTVQENDSLFAISQKFNLGNDGIALILYLNPYTPTATNPGIDPATQGIFVGQVIKIPNPGMPLPTPTPIPSNIPRGTVVNYTIQPGDTLPLIASKFNSTADDIQKINNIVDPNKILVGQQIKVRVNIVTPTPTRPATITPGPSTTPPSPYTETPPGGLTLTPTMTVTP
ncbi:MAG: LysM peptidoglycan-binding domain-containing protein [Anaerolineales bacterium]